MFVVCVSMRICSCLNMLVTCIAETIKLEVELEWTVRMKQSEDEMKASVENLTSELDRIRGAFNGDASGWEERRVKGDVFYENTDTGEVRSDMPEVLFIYRAMQRVDDADAKLVEFKKLEDKYKALDIKQKESEISIQKLRSELNAIRQIDKQWKDCAKVLFNGLNDYRNQMFTQSDQIICSMDEIGPKPNRIHDNDPKVKSIDRTIVQYKKRIKDQEATIDGLNAKVRQLTMDLEDQTDKVQRLSRGLEEEVQRRITPMVRKLSETMTLNMVEKVQRDQERRELAALWPPEHMMPSVWNILFESNTWGIV
jgi:uncharacterized protein YukE